MQFQNGWKLGYWLYEWCARFRFMADKWKHYNIPEHERLDSGFWQKNSYYNLALRHLWGKLQFGRCSEQYKDLFVLTSSQDLSSNWRPGEGLLVVHLHKMYVPHTNHTPCVVKYVVGLWQYLSYITMLFVASNWRRPQCHSEHTALTHSHLWHTHITNMQMFQRKSNIFVKIWMKVVVPVGF